MAIELSEHDHVPMEKFRRKWRWTDAKWNLLPPEELARIQPLTEGKATELRRYLGKFFDGPNLDSRQFTTLSKMDDQHNSSPEVARAWLSERITDKTEKVWVSFNNLHAVVTDAAIFSRYWNDFCYPGGDNIVIWPFGESWVLYYFHEEELFFGQRST